MRLKGEPKKHLITKNAHQLQLSSALQKEAVPGETIQLTIDAQLQVIGYDLFEKFQSQGSLVCLDPHTGEILALVSYPGYDPHLLREDPHCYHQDERRPMFFRALQGLYPPASIVKPFLGIAALEDTIVTPTVTIYDPGYYQLPGTQKRFHDWKRVGHRNTNLHQAIVESCDTYFYWLGHKMGIEKMTQWFSLFGFGARFEAIPFTHKIGVTPSVEWKRQTLHQPWFLGETIIAAIGQGFFSTTPLHLAYAGGLLASRGKTPTPSLLKGEIGSPPSEKLGEIQSWEIIHQAMREVITSPQGTAYSRLSKKLKYPLAGKTGTAQVVSNETAKAYKEFSHRDHSLFLAFDVIDKPELVVVVVCEHQPFAAEIAGEFMNQALGLIHKTKILTTVAPV
jgi:penicillin-binding protein 2